jgi:hypothetical protein
VRLVLILFATLTKHGCESSMIVMFLILFNSDTLNLKYVMQSNDCEFIIVYIL